MIVFPVNLDDAVFLDGIKGCLGRIDKQAHPDIAWDSRLIYHDQASLIPARVLGKSMANNTERLTLSLRMKAACLWYSKHFYTAGNSNIFWKNYKEVALRGGWGKKTGTRSWAVHLLLSRLYVCWYGNVGAKKRKQLARMVHSIIWLQYKKWNDFHITTENYDLCMLWIWNFSLN